MAQQKSSNEGSGGKLLDTWIYEYEGILHTEVEEDDGSPRPAPQVVGKKVVVELRLIKKFTDSDKPPLATKEVWFRVVCKEAGIKLEGTDVEILRKTMFGQLDKKYEVLWEDYFLVTIKPEHPYDGQGTGLMFSYERVEKGIAWDGTLLIRERRWAHDATISPWPGEFKDKDGKFVACIPASTENRKAVQEFAERIDLLRGQLADCLRPNNIMKTLTGMSNLALLPAPQPMDPEEGDGANQ